MSIKETMSENLQVPVGKTDRSRRRKRFAMLPSDVLSRTDITASARLVLAAMNMESLGSGRVAVSDGILAIVAGVSRGQIVEVRRRLEAAGLIQKDGPPSKQVQAYLLLHPDMCGAGEVREPLTRRPKMELRPCARCKTQCVPQKRTGWCKTCSTEARKMVITKTMVCEVVVAVMSRRESA